MSSVEELDLPTASVFSTFAAESLQNRGFFFGKGRKALLPAGGLSKFNKIPVIPEGIFFVHFAADDGNLALIMSQEFPVSGLDTNIMFFSHVILYKTVSYF